MAAKPPRKRKPKRPRNPVVKVARQLGKRVKESAKAYRRRPKHEKAPPPNDAG
jgi:hypothetical protein